MRIQVLLSVMNLEDWKKQVKLMNATSDVVIINQITDPKLKPLNHQEGGVVLHSFKEKGLSKSRNKALKIADADICLLADGDVTFEKSYERTVKRAFRDNPDADIIVFRVDRVDGSAMQVRRGKIGMLYSMKVNSKQIAFRRDSVLASGVEFNERFGAGTDFYMGEENIFLSECRKRGLKIISYPVKIAHLRPHVSTWSRERNTHYFYIKGRMFYRISVPLGYFFGVQFALRKSGARNQSVALPKALLAIIKGVYDESRKR